MKKFLYLLVVSCFFILTPKDSIAQPPPQPFAAGEIVVNPVGTAPCGGLHRMEILVKFYRDAGGGNAMFPDPFTVTLVNTKIMQQNPAPSSDGFITVNLTEVSDRGEVDNECIQGDPIVTIGKWYSAEVLLEESETPWNIYYGFVRELVVRGKRVPQVIGDVVHSPEHLNIELGQRFTIRTDFKVQCEDITTRVKDVPSAYSTSNTIYNNRTAELLTEDLLQTFCHGQDYEFQIPIYDFDNPRADLNFDGTIDPGESLGADSLHFELTSALKGSQAVLYVPPYSSTNPVPVDFGSRMKISKDGFITFSPRLDPNERSFFGAVTIKVSEYRKRVVSIPKNFGGGADYDSLAYEWDPEPIAVTYRQFRYVIDRNCNKNLPEFTRDSLHWNYDEEAWEFDCGTTSFTFDMSFPMYEHSLKRGGIEKYIFEDGEKIPVYKNDHLDIRIIRGTPQNPLSDDAEPVLDIIPRDQTPLELALGEFSKFELVTQRSLGPGWYSFYFKLGKDQNTLINRCGFQVPEFKVIPVYINGDFEYNYFDKDEPISICYPQENIRFNPLVGMPDVRFGDEFEFKFHYTQNRQPPNPPTVPWDTTFSNFYAGRTSPENTYTEEIELNQAGNPIFKEGTWKIEVGRIYRYEFQDSIYRTETCYDDDDVFVSIFENKGVLARKWDLCPDESWPIIDLDTMSTLHNAQDFVWGLEEKVINESGEFLRDEFGNFVKEFRPVGGSGNSRFPVASVAFGNNGIFNVRSVVQLENGECFDTSLFEIRKGPVEASIGNDSTICPGQQYLLIDTITHYTPDSVSYEWTLNGNVIPTTEEGNSVLITEAGTYKLRVTKRSELDKNGQQVECYGEDSVVIRIADQLYPPAPKCTRVTFRNDSVRQTFFWPEIEGTNGYQVKVITPATTGPPDTTDWIDPNGEYNLIHYTAGREVQLMVRGYNWEVPDNSICKYGPVSYIAEPCEVVIEPINIFTPNGDGINETLRFDLLEIYLGNHLQVFNRWGELLYEDVDYLNDWDGGDLKDGTYYYVLRVGDDAGSILTGNVTIVR